MGKLIKLGEIKIDPQINGETIGSDTTYKYYIVSEGSNLVHISSHGELANWYEYAGAKNLGYFEITAPIVCHNLKQKIYDEITEIIKTKFPQWNLV